MDKEEDHIAQGNEAQSLLDFKGFNSVIDGLALNSIVVVGNYSLASITGATFRDIRFANNALFMPMN